MKVLKSFLILTIAILGFSFVNVDARGFSSNSEVTQQQIEKKIFKKIVNLPNYGVFDNIQFSLDGETVTLTGKVYSLGTSSTAAKVVKKIDGVGKVINNIETLSGSRFDNRIRQQAIRRFANGGSLYRYLVGPRPSVRIIVDNGHLTLEGYVSNDGDYRLASILAKGIPGTFSVTNNLEVTKIKKY